MNKDNDTEENDDQKKSSFGLSNPVIWIIALGIVVAWKWDEIKNYF